MTGPHVTYGELLHDARRQVIDALASIRTDGLSTPEGARTVLALRTAALVAARRNAITALGPARTEAVLEHLHSSRRHPSPAHPDTAAIATWLRTLPTDGTSRTRHLANRPAHSCCGERSPWSTRPATSWPRTRSRPVRCERSPTPPWPPPRSQP